MGSHLWCIWNLLNMYNHSAHFTCVHLQTLSEFGCFVSGTYIVVTTGMISRALILNTNLLIISVNGHRPQHGSVSLSLSFQIWDSHSWHRRSRTNTQTAWWKSSRGFFLTYAFNRNSLQVMGVPCALIFLCTCLPGDGEKIGSQERLIESERKFDVVVHFASNDPGSPAPYAHTHFRRRRCWLCWMRKERWKEACTSVRMEAISYSLISVMGRSVTSIFNPQVEKLL